MRQIRALLKSCADYSYVSHKSFDIEEKVS
jgi:hypothetical protein